MKKAFLLFFAAFAVLFFISCGNEDNATCNDDETGASQTFSVKLITDNCAKNTIHANSLINLVSVSFVIKDMDGNSVFQKSFSQANIAANMKISGIKNVDNATLIIAGFGEDPNRVAWFGKVSGLSFKKDQETSVTVVLYPTSGRACLPDGLITPRFGHTATLLPDGRILIAGGFTLCNATTGKCPATKSVELLDTESGTVEKLADLSEERGMHSAILLQDGSVLFFGGVRSFLINSTSLNNYPNLPYSPNIQAISVEKYMPPYPKLNMKNNHLGSPVENTTQVVPADIPFMPFQSYYVETVSEGPYPSQTKVYMAGGLDPEESLPSDKVYTFTVTESEDGTLSVSDATEIAAVDGKEPMLLPILGVNDGLLFAVGGKPNNPASPATLFSESEATAWESENSANLFYSQGLMLNGNLYTFGGYSNNNSELVGDSKIRRWNIADKSVTVGSKNLLSWGTPIVFSDVSYDSKNNRFIIVGGTGGSKSDLMAGNDIYQVADANDLTLFDEPVNFTLSYKRIMPKTIIIPAGYIGDNPMIFITGGITSLNGTGTTVSAIEINNL